MGMRLVPIEDGVRIEGEKRLAKEDESKGVLLERDEQSTSLGKGINR